MSKTEDSDTISQNGAYDILSNERRRFVLSYLSRVDGPVELGELAEEIGRWETGSESLSRKERKRVYVSLYQTHIPRLADAGVIEYDSETGLVRLVERARDIGRYVGKPTEDREWPIYYLTVVVAGALFYSLVVMDVVTFVSDTIGGLLVLGLLTLVAVTHILSTRRERMAAFQSDKFIEDRR
jgi:hypothetical protein